MRKQKDFIITYFQRDIDLIVLLANDWLLIIAKSVFVSSKTLERIWRKNVKILNYTHIRFIKIIYSYQLEIYHFVFYLCSNFSIEFNSIINIWILQISYEYLLLRLISKDVNNALWLKINQKNIRKETNSYLMLWSYGVYLNIDDTN